VLSKIMGRPCCLHLFKTFNVRKNKGPLTLLWHIICMHFLHWATTKHKHPLMDFNFQLQRQLYLVHYELKTKLTMYEQEFHI
jgi:hypothetical protein